LLLSLILLIAADFFLLIYCSYLFFYSAIYNFYRTARCNFFIFFKSSSFLFNYFLCYRRISFIYSSKSDNFLRRWSTLAYNTRGLMWVPCKFFKRISISCTHFILLSYIIRIINKKFKTIKIIF
jgi:hypothetical protein